MKQLTFQFEGFAPECVKENGISLQVIENVSKISENLNTRVKNFIECTTGAALTHRHAVGGVALISGLVLATGADTIPQALLTLAAFLVAGTCLHEKQEKGGEV